MACRGGHGAVAIHGAYDFILTLGSFASLIFLVVLTLGWVVAFRVMKAAMRHASFAIRYSSTAAGADA